MSLRSGFTGLAQLCKNFIRSDLLGVFYKLFFIVGKIDDRITADIRDKHFVEDVDEIFIPGGLVGLDKDDEAFLLRSFHSGLVLLDFFLGIGNEFSLYGIFHHTDLVVDKLVS